MSRISIDLLHSLCRPKTRLVLITADTWLIWSDRNLPTRRTQAILSIKSRWPTNSHNFQSNPASHPRPTPLTKNRSKTKEKCPPSLGSPLALPSYHFSQSLSPALKSCLGLRWLVFWLLSFWLFFGASISPRGLILTRWVFFQLFRLLFPYRAVPRSFLLAGRRG